MASIADLFGRLLLDDSGFEADVVKTMTKAGQSGGRSMGEQISGSLKGMAVRGVGLAIAGGLAVAAKGVAELENVVADFRAETGATEEEAKKAGQAILEMSSRNIQPLGEIGKVLTKVHTDMGLTGGAAAKTTEAFLKFGRATKQDAAAAVSAFDNILDAWNLTAEDSQALMDKLVVSNQKYGGVISENEAALAAMAPAMQAANMSIDDGIALLNLFNTAGIDASKAPAVLAQAIKQLKPGQDLNDLIAQIGAIEDPTRRAQEAMKVFGARAGIGMAQAIKPGMTSLADLTASLGDTTGATVKAADVLDSTFTSWIALKIKAVGAAIIDLGSGVGPAVTALGGLATVIGTLGGDKLLSAFGPKLLEAFKALGKKAGSAIGDGVEAVMTGAQGTVLGNFIASRIEVILGPKNSRLGDAARAAGAKLGAIFGPAFAVGSKIAEAVTSLLVRLPGMGMVRSAALASGMALGGAYGAAVAAGMAAAVVVAVAAIADSIRKPLSDLGTQIHTALMPGGGPLDDLGASWMEWRRNTPWPLGQKDAPDWAKIGGDTAAGVDAAVVEPMRESLTKGGDLGDRLAAKLAASLGTITSATKSLAIDSNRSWELFVGGATSMRERLAFNAERIKAAIHDLTATLLGEAQALIDGYYDPIIAQDELRVQKDQVTADTIARNATKAGSAERHQANLTLANSQKVLDQTRANLLAAGTLSAKEQKTWLGELEKRYKTATGNAKTEIGLLIAKIKELQRVPTTIVEIIAEIKSRRIPPRAAGGPVTAGQPYLVNEDTPRSELFVPDVNGRIVTQAQAAATAATAPSASRTMAGPSGDTHIHVAVEGLLRARTPFELSDNLRRLADFGVLSPRRRWANE